MIKEKFINYLQYEKRYSENTLKSYHRDIDNFLSYLRDYYEISDLATVNHQMIRSWIIFSLDEKDLSAASINRMLSTLKSLFKFAKANSLVINNPTLKVLGPKKPKRLPEFAEQQDVLSLLENQEFYQKGYKGLLEKTVLELFYQTGMRLSELISIQIKDVDFSEGYIKVLGKRNKERFIPIAGEMIGGLQNYLDKRQNISNVIDKDLVFITEKGKALYPTLVYRMINRLLQAGTTLKKTSPHILRHSFATHLLNNGADLNTIKELLGHSSLAATQVYTHNSFEQLKNIHKQAHPRA